MYLVYKTDNLHSYASRDIIGIATCSTIAISLCLMQAKKEGCEIKGDQLHNLINLKQTQGYMGDGEFFFEEVEEGALL